MNTPDQQPEKVRTRTITIHTVGLASQCTTLVENGMDRTRTLGKHMYHDEQLAFCVGCWPCVSFLIQAWSM